MSSVSVIISLVTSSVKLFKLAISDIILVNSNVGIFGYMFYYITNALMGILLAYNRWQNTCNILRFVQYYT
jgi:hypothetical protein